MVAYYCLHKLHLLPSQFFQLERKERAFIIAAVQCRAEAEKKQEQQAQAKAKAQGARGRRKR